MVFKVKSLNTLNLGLVPLPLNYVNLVNLSAYYIFILQVNILLKKVNILFKKKRGSLIKSSIYSLNIWFFFFNQKNISKLKCFICCQNSEILTLELEKASNVRRASTIVLCGGSVFIFTTHLQDCIYIQCYT